MSEPTARELLEQANLAGIRITEGLAPMRIPADPTDPDIVIARLASRVEKVLALLDYDDRDPCESGTGPVYVVADTIRRILNGEAL